LTYFVADDLILLFVSFVELLGTMCAFSVYGYYFVVYVYVQELVSEKPTREIISKAHYIGMLVKSP
jgi:hypothetical protein